jgi:hypothetical protein
LFFCRSAPLQIDVSCSLFTLLLHHKNIPSKPSFIQYDIFTHCLLFFGLVQCLKFWHFNPLNAKLNPICHLLALLGAHHIFHVSRVRVKTWHFSSQKHWLPKHRVLKCIKILDNGQGQKKEIVAASYTPHQNPIVLSYDIFNSYLCFLVHYFLWKCLNFL